MAVASAAGVVVVLCAAVVLALAGALLLRHQAVAGPPPPPDVRSQGRDALWLGHRWVDGRGEIDGHMVLPGGGGSATALSVIGAAASEP